MNEILCPHCGKAFKVDEAGYADILKQVRNAEFDHELHARLELAEKEKLTAVELARKDVASELQKIAAAKDIEIQRLQADLEAGETAIKLAVAEAVSEVEKKHSSLAAELEKARHENLAATRLAEEKLAAASDKQKLAVAEAVSVLEKERDELKNGLQQSALEKKLSEKSLKEKYETQIKDRDEAIERLRDMKARLSTKMVGESLEQHCETEFNRIRATAFPRAYFEKDNDASSGSKGDYIFRDVHDDDVEIVSIMFEMKNETDTTATKKKNEDFLKELDKDRNEKGCEYAILVSLLEPESELYNSGIVDVFHRYPKMYVIRPQFFIPIITLLRNAAMKSLEYRTELALVKAQNIDVTNFENDLHKFQTAFAKNYDLASRQFQKAIDEIDKSINHMQKTKDNLLASIRNIRLANDKAQDVSIKRLTRNNPTMAAKFEEIGGEEAADEQGAHTSNGGHLQNED